MLDGLTNGMDQTPQTITTIKGDIGIFTTFAIIIYDFEVLLVQN